MTLTHTQHVFIENKAIRSAKNPTKNLTWFSDSGTRIRRNTWVKEPERNVYKQPLVTSIVTIVTSIA